MSENPLKQYFRRPSIYIQLPSKCRFYTPDVVDMQMGGEIAVYPMSAIDEITARTPDALFNGQAVVDIIKSCVPSIKKPEALNTIDIDAILVAIKIASSGEYLDVTSKCPSCGTEGTYSMDMNGVLASRKDIDYNTTLKLRDLEIKFRPLTLQETNKNGMSQYEVQRLVMQIQEVEDGDEREARMRHAVEYLNKLTMEIISSTIEWIRTPETTVTEKQFIQEFLQHCDRQTHNTIKDYSVKLREESQLPDMPIKCSECGHEYTQQLTLNVSDFFV